MNAGYSAGWCSVAFKLDLYAVEILCKAKGLSSFHTNSHSSPGDPCCRFIMCNQSCLVDRVRKYQEQHKDLAVHDCSVLPGVCISNFALLIGVVHKKRTPNT